MDTNVAYKQWLAESDESIVFLDKAEGGKVAIEDVREGLQEYKRLFRAGLASPAEILTLHRAYPDVSKYANVVEILDLSDESEPTVIGGPASVELVDREGHLITSEALEDAFRRYMDNFRTRNVMVMHSDVQVGHALPVYISKGGQIFKSGVEGSNLFFISELRDDTKISQKVKEQIHSGKMRSYSIAGSATKTQNISKGADSYMQVDSLELAEITICEKGVNQGAHFELMKAEQLIPTEPVDNLFVISKEDIPSFTEVFSTWFGKASKEGIVPELNGKQMAVLENGTARQIQHRALLDELGFPMYVYPEDLRHPVDYDEPGRPVPSKIVNQAGQDLGDANIEEMVKSATDTFTSILRKQDSDKTTTRTKTTYLGSVPRAAVSSTQRTQQGSGGQLLPAQADKINLTTKARSSDPSKGPSYVGSVTTETSTRAPKGASTSQRTTAVPTEKMNETTPVHEPNINPVDMNDYTGDEEKDKATEKGLIGDIAGGAAKGIGGAAAGGAAGVTGSKQKIDWAKSTEKGFLRETSPRKDEPSRPYAYTKAVPEGRSAKRPSYFNVGEHSLIQTSVDEDEEEDKRTEKGFFQETAPRKTETGPRGKGEYVKGEDPAFSDAPRSKKNPSYFNVGEHSLIQTSVDEDDEDESLKKSTDIFKRVLEAERPDETWTGTDKEVPVEKIIGALLAPVAGVIGAGLGAAAGAVGSAAGGIAGGAAKKILGG